MHCVVFNWNRKSCPHAWWEWCVLVYSRPTAVKTAVDPVTSVIPRERPRSHVVPQPGNLALPIQTTVTPRKRPSASNPQTPVAGTDCCVEPTTGFFTSLCIMYISRSWKSCFLVCVIETLMSSRYWNTGDGVVYVLIIMRIVACCEVQIMKWIVLNHRLLVWIGSVGLLFTVWCGCGLLGHLLSWCTGTMAAAATASYCWMLILLLLLILVFI